MIDCEAVMPHVFLVTILIVMMVQLLGGQYELFSHTDFWMSRHKGVADDIRTTITGKLLSAIETVPHVAIGFMCEHGRQSRDKGRHTIYIYIYRKEKGNRVK